MEKENLILLSEISKDICDKMIAYQSKEKDVVILPKSFLDNWQRGLFKIVADETNINH